MIFIIQHNLMERYLYSETVVNDYNKLIYMLESLDSNINLFSKTVFNNSRMIESEYGFNIEYTKDIERLYRNVLSKLYKLTKSRFNLIQDSNGIHRWAINLEDEFDTFLIKNNIESVLIRPQTQQVFL